MIHDACAGFPRFPKVSLAYAKIILPATHDGDKTSKCFQANRIWCAHSIDYLEGTEEMLLPERASARRCNTFGE
jgi:hypothetical protein